ncbi:MAG: Transposase like protein [Gemmataceae bacterium]|nr:Transposase like protein [Gemmataceae bacterium]
MPQSFARVLVHAVFSTKNREPLITARHRDRLFDYLGGSLNTLGCQALCVGGVADHVHLLFGRTRTLPICKVMEEVKKESSKWAKEAGEPAFYWQTGYGTFSVSPSNVPQVSADIANQEEHHRTMTF